MKRDWHLIRHLLLNIENNESSFWGKNLLEKYPPDWQLGKYSPEECQYHLNLLIDADFIEGNLTDGYQCSWLGKQLIDTLRDERKYNLAIKEIEANGGGATTEVLVGLIKRTP